MPELTIRQIQKDDLFNGFLESLDALRKTSDIDRKTAEDVFEKISSNPNHHIFVAVLENKIVGSTTLLIEPKFIHNGGLVGHIEDVVVSRKNQGEGIGEELIKHSLNFAKNAGCYKTILDCKDDVIEFYEKLGFFKNSSEMRVNHT